MPVLISSHLFCSSWKCRLFRIVLVESCVCVVLYCRIFRTLGLRCLPGRGRGSLRMRTTERQGRDERVAGRHMTHFLFRSKVVYLVLLVALVFGGLAQRALASGVAPNGPGAASNWTPSNNTLLGTAANTSSDVWFTGYNGIIGEVFYPTADT